MNKKHEVPTREEFFSMLPSARKAYVDSLPKSDREWFFRTLATMPKDDAGQEWFINGADSVMEEVFDIFLNPEKYANEGSQIDTPTDKILRSCGPNPMSLTDQKKIASSRRDFARSLLTVSSDTRKRLLSLWCEKRALENRRLGENVVSVGINGDIEEVKAGVQELVRKKRKTHAKNVKSGRKGGSAKKADRDPMYEKAVDYAIKLLKEREEGKHPSLSKEGCYLKASKKFLLDDKKTPMFSKANIKIGVMRRQKETRGKHDRTGKPRGRYKIKS